VDTVAKAERSRLLGCSTLWSPSGTTYSVQQQVRYRTAFFWLGVYVECRRGWDRMSFAISCGKVRAVTPSILQPISSDISHGRIHVLESRFVATTDPSSAGPCFTSGFLAWLIPAPSRWKLHADPETSVGIQGTDYGAEHYSGGRQL
jgi:hypothetical protein